MDICTIGADATVKFAAGELARYLKAMTGTGLKVRAARAYDPAAGGVWVGLVKDFEELAGVPRKLPSVESGGDGVYVQAGAGRAVVAGSNPRSVLFAAYRWLEELGCRWLRPGRGGERLPRVADALSPRVRLRETPSARHRVICIEGSVSLGHVRDMIDYAAKRGFNAYFLQFRTCYTFFNRWYGVESRRGLPSQPITLGRAQELRDRAAAEALRRGMALHAVGHGWTCEPFGIPGTEWAAYKGAVPAEAGRHFALVGGRRDLWGGVPLNTNLCYSDPAVRSIMAGAVVRYAGDHPHEEVIHVWLADGANNNCECAACRKERPSDFYVQILNEIDARLAAGGLSTRIVFLAYVDLLWAPRRHRLRNPDRFILMFAPITRSYERAFLDREDKAGDRITPYRRNRLKFPASPRVNLKMLDQWREKFPGECVAFDYHLMWAHHYDPGQMALARVLHKDVRDLRKLGMDGFISCQSQRAAFPTGLCLHLMGRTLWDRRTPFGATVDEYLTDLFGPQAPAVRRYLTRLSALFAPPVLRGERSGDQARRRAIRGLQRVQDHVDAFAPALEAGCGSSDAVTAAAWRLLGEHGWYAAQWADILARALRKDTSARDRFLAFDREMNRRLPRLHHVCDTFLAREMLKRTMWQNGIVMQPAAPGG